MNLPSFKYHPDPISTGTIEKSKNVCICCGLARGFIYTGSVYSLEEINDAICPWCIKSGEAADKYDATFNDDHALTSAGISKEIREEVCKRTPGYISWQAEEWLSHCDDACAFMGDATPEELIKLTGLELEQLLIDQMLSKEDWTEIMKNYEPGGSPAVYAFQCLHCKGRKYTMDFD
jgi:uncharacterized protein CbrC (UPF0167 family)